MIDTQKSRVIWCNRGWLPVSFGFCPDAEAWGIEMQVMGYDTPYPAHCHATATGFTTETGGYCVLVTMPPAKRKATVSIGLIVHECAHVWQIICRQIEEATPGDEMEAYALQAITQEMIGAMEKAGRIKIRNAK